MISVRPSKKNSIAERGDERRDPDVRGEEAVDTRRAAAATTSARITLGTSGIPAVVSFQNMNGVNRYSAPIDRSISPQRHHEHLRPPP